MLLSCMRCLGAGRAMQLSAAALTRRPYTTETVNSDKSFPERIEKSVNQVILLGRAGADAEMRGSEQYPVVQFSMATHVNFQKGEETFQNTVWHRVSVFKPSLRDSVYKHLKKGQRVMVQGRLGYYEKKESEDSAVINKTASIVAHDVVFFGN